MVETSMLVILWKSYIVHMNDSIKATKAGNKMVGQMHRKMANEIMDVYFAAIDEVTVPIPETD